MIDEPQVPLPPPPWDKDAEEAVLGAMLVSSPAIPRVRETGLRAEEFYRRSHGLVYETICRLTDAGEAADSITVTEALAGSSELSDEGAVPGCDHGRCPGRR